MDGTGTGAIGVEDADEFAEIGDGLGLRLVERDVRPAGRTVGASTQRQQGACCGGGEEAASRCAHTLRIGR
ncbi:Uncharacterised protein [Mycobacteroides abscessus subsp. abscessus]|nr:Uncharacterised protein [Mycobacteroides abscessus subsp. abscessus]